tara:strand:- start:5317 stop:5799 length:483 start_codon:yes stop_codon:yes gene_type:complete
MRSESEPEPPNTSERSSIATVVTSEGKRAQEAFRRIPTRHQRQEYADLVFQVLRGQEELLQFDKGRTRFFLGGTKVDFNKEVLVLLPHAQASGSTVVTYGIPLLNERTLTFPIETANPTGNETQDMAYYCLVVAVDRSRVDTVVLQAGEHRHASLSLESP